MTALRRAALLLVLLLPTTTILASVRKSYEIPPECRIIPVDLQKPKARLEESYLLSLQPPPPDRGDGWDWSLRIGGRPHEFARASFEEDLQVKICPPEKGGREEAEVALVIAGGGREVEAAVLRLRRGRTLLEELVGGLVSLPFAKFTGFTVVALVCLALAPALTQYRTGHGSYLIQNHQLVDRVKHVEWEGYRSSKRCSRTSFDRAFQALSRESRWKSFFEGTLLDLGYRETFELIFYRDTIQLRLCSDGHEPWDPNRARGHLYATATAGGGLEFVVFPNSQGKVGSLELLDRRFRPKRADKPFKLLPGQRHYLRSTGSTRTCGWLIRT